ncbi:sensor histidine kinase [Minicystis rosea]|nr:sensor histidine kinase [Minicystis rosea]
MTPDSARSGVSVASLDELVSAADRAVVDANVSIVSSAPGAAFLVWGPEVLCLAHNRQYRSLAALRVSVVGKPLFRSQPEVERAWRAKLDLVYAGSSATLDGSALSGGPEGSGDSHLGWLLPVYGPSGAKGALGMFMDAGVVVEPARRIIGALGQDLREPTIGIQVVAERLARLPKPTRERCVEDMDRVIELTRLMDRLIDDMGAFARRSSAAGGARLSLRHGDLGTIVKLACERIDVGKHPPLRVNVVEVPGLWDDEAILRILTTLVTSACQSSDTAAVTVEVSALGREGACILVKDDGPGLRSDDVDQLFEPWRRGLAPGAERRRRGAGLGLFLARELVSAHGGRITGERTPSGGFALRVLLPIPGNTNPAPSSRSFKTLG